MIILFSVIIVEVEVETDILFSDIVLCYFIGLLDSDKKNSIIF